MQSNVNPIVWLTKQSLFGSLFICFHWNALCLNTDKNSLTGLDKNKVAILLYLAQNLVNLLWRCSIDPDNYSTPLLTATGDLLGCAFLLVVFVIAYQFNDPYALTTV